jgi:uncharacterized membrane protein YgcG
MLASFRSMSVVPWILFAQASSMMDYVPSITATQPKPTRAAGEIRDRGGVFGRAAVLRAQEALGEVYRRQRIPVQVETVRSLDGAWIADVAQRRATSAGADRLYILVAGEEREVGIVGARHGPASRLTDQQRETIRRSFLGRSRRVRPASRSSRASGRSVRRSTPPRPTRGRVSAAR